MLTVTFSDGTKATVFSGDMIAGGVRNLIETYTSGGALFLTATLVGVPVPPGILYTPVPLTQPKP